MVGGQISRPRVSSWNVGARIVFSCPKGCVRIAWATIRRPQAGFCLASQRRCFRALRSVRRRSASCFRVRPLSVRGPRGPSASELLQCAAFPRMRFRTRLQSFRRLVRAAASPKARGVALRHGFPFSQLHSDREACPHPAKASAQLPRSAAVSRRSGSALCSMRLLRDAASARHRSTEAFAAWAASSRWRSLSAPGRSQLPGAAVLW